MSTVIDRPLEMPAFPTTPERLRVEVTRADIDKGEPKLPGSCAVAVAMNRMYGNFWSVGGVSMDNCETGAVYRIPSHAKCWIARFDAEGPDSVQPISFEVERIP